VGSQTLKDVNFEPRACFQEVKFNDVVNRYIYNGDEYFPSLSPAASTGEILEINQVVRERMCIPNGSSGTTPISGFRVVIKYYLILRV